MAELGLLDLHYRLPLSPPAPAARARIVEALGAMGLSVQGAPATHTVSM